MRFPRAQAEADDLVEGVAKVLAEQGVDARIDGRIAVAQPEEYGEEQRRDAVVTEGPYDVHGEEGQPAADETAHDDAQRFRRLGLHFEAFHLRLDVAPVQLGHRRLAGR